LSVNTSWDINIEKDDDVLKSKACQVYKALTCNKISSVICDIGGND
jgi:hypothetical protein